MQLPEHEYKDLEREHFEICHSSTVCILLSASKNNEQLLVVFLLMRCTTHLVYPIDKETLQERIRVLFFSGLVSLIAKVAAIRKLATPSEN